MRVKQINSKAVAKKERDFCAIANRYARDVVSGKEIANKWHIKACKRHLDDLKKKRWPYVFDEWHGNDICLFIEELPHVEGEWDDPTIRLTDSWIFILVSVFGWRKKADLKRRRFTTAYIETARKNAKSAITSGVMLYCLTCEGEPGPQIKTAATTGDQARIVFGVAKKMVEKTPDIVEAFNLDPMANSIVCHENMGSIQPINAKASTQDGLNPHAYCMDELHAHKDRDLFDVLKSARGARKNPLSWYITTAGYNLLGVCYEQRKFVAKVLNGIIDADHYFGIIFTIDEDDDPYDEKIWRKSNPNLGVITQFEEFRDYALEAKNSPESQSEFLTKRLNIWLSAKGGWANMDAWKKCGGNIDLKALESVPCYAGLDLASTTDIAAFVMVWRVDGILYPWCKFYLPEDTVQPRTERGNVPYQTWVQQGHLTITPGNVTDYRYIEADIKKAMSNFDIRQIAYDDWNANDLTNRLVEDSAPMICFRQGPKSYNPPMRALERHIEAKTINHGDNPVLTWMASNLVSRKDQNENMAPDKKKSEEKIDGMVSLLMGLGVLMDNEEDTGPMVSYI